MKRSRKTVFALLLALVMTLGLAATAGATEVVPTESFKRGLSITKEVKQTGDVTPPAETFTFVLEDAVKEGEKHDLAYYGITQLDELKIPTATGNEITKPLALSFRRLTLPRTTGIPARMWEVMRLPGTTSPSF